MRLIQVASALAVSACIALAAEEGAVPANRVPTPSAQAVLAAIAKGDAPAAFAAATEGEQKGDATCVYLLGQMHEQGRGVQNADPIKAFALYEQAAKSGVPEALSAVARCLETGVGTKPNLEKSLFVWQQAAEAGDPPALGRMGLAEMAGHARPVSFETARAWIEKAAQARDPLGKWLLSRFYDQGLAGITVSASKAVELCSEAAAAGQLDAMNQMGQYYAAGRGLPQDSVAAAGWYRLATDYGHSGGAAALALCYFDGRGVRQNDRLATELASKAARAGEPRGQYLLGRIFEEGVGCAPSPVFALAYHLRASKNGVKEASTAIDRLRTKLHVTAIKQAEKLAEQPAFHLDPASATTQTHPEAQLAAPFTPK
ncbi:MAG: sodium-type flagellar motor component [Chthoniobacter sp.]|nr:sodium-type flagellar motor component [Chthoniobacter sp.]